MNNSNCTNRCWKTVYFPVLAGLILLTACAGNPPFDQLSISNDYTQISMPDGRTWSIAFEKNEDTVFSGIVRHDSRWLNPGMPFMTHDILVTTQDFSSPDIVQTVVIDHHYIYRSKLQHPQGGIYLLHILPASQEIFDALQKIRKWNEVKITGREIYRINRYDADGNEDGYFMDMGCHTILVTDVEIVGGK